MLLFLIFLFLILLDLVVWKIAGKIILGIIGALIALDVLIMVPALLLCLIF